MTAALDAFTFVGGKQAPVESPKLGFVAQWESESRQRRIDSFLSELSILEACARCWTTWHALAEKVGKRLDDGALMDSVTSEQRDEAWHLYRKRKREADNCFVQAVTHARGVARMWSLFDEPTRAELEPNVRAYSDAAIWRCIDHDMQIALNSAWRTFAAVAGKGMPNNVECPY